MLNKNKINVSINSAKLDIMDFYLNNSKSNSAKQAISN